MHTPLPANPCKNQYPIGARATPVVQGQALSRQRYDAS
ncbi:hypothetical protein ZHAS_00004556 [Acetobacter orientalis]|uniref:Uncharacterized protein n=1 Tax=Acetobacter orientalis TaxID=146474 RepID=A0A2Z5ZCZ5_9PROT|nr:hypothetical protein ZHAS_00004556 [Acetobacter orientalis]